MVRWGGSKKQNIIKHLGTRQFLICYSLGPIRLKKPWNSMKKNHLNVFYPYVSFQSFSAPSAHSSFDLKTASQSYSKVKDNVPSVWRLSNIIMHFVTAYHAYKPKLITLSGSPSLGRKVCVNLAMHLTFNPHLKISTNHPVFNPVLLRDLIISLLFPHYPSWSQCVFFHRYTSILPILPPL
jgi:hypothetical protein